MKKIAINTSIGGFKLSVKGALRCWELGMKDIGTTVAEEYPTAEDILNASTEEARVSMESLKKLKDDDLVHWNAYLAGEHTWYTAIFTPDKKYKLHPFISNFPDENGKNPREDPILIQVLEEMGTEAYHEHHEFKIVGIPDDVEYEIMESEEGYESIHEKHRIWS